VAAHHDTGRYRQNGKALADMLEALADGLTVGVIGVFDG
jgi:hypothetical protein